MPGSDYAILLSDALKRQLEGLDRAALRIVREKLEFLASGLWEGGLRVKKLQGTEGRAVFEARMSAGERLLFTLGRDRGRSIIYAWGIEAHDDVARACRSVLPENAPFLSFKPLSIEELPELPAAGGDSPYFTQEGIEGLSHGDYGPQRWRVMEDSDWERLLASAEGQETELRLYLTEEQLSFLERPPPLFISGTSGSGKTTLALYYLLRPLPPGSRRLFVTKHPNLREHAKRQYEALVSGRGEPQGLPPPRFSTYRELLLEILSPRGAGGGLDFEGSREVDFPAFERMFKERREFSSLDPELAWEEIRGIIKGARPAGRLDQGGSLLTFEDYSALGHKRSPRFARERELIYAAAEWYEDHLRKEGLWDEIDLTRAAFDLLSRPEGTPDGVARNFRPWDLLVCDEAQDFTRVHSELLLRLVADPVQVVLAGDVKQIIDPSGFRWADLRALFWERGLQVPELFRLGLNFRSVGGIVSIANALLELKKRLAGIQSEEGREGWKFLGKTPCLVTGIDEESLASELARAATGAGAGAAIIVRDLPTRARLKALLGSDLVFTVGEAKGLEFEAVLLWNLSSGQGEIAALWRRLAGDDRLAEGREARIVHEINLYYVAVTRARGSLVVCERNGDFWDRDEFEGLFVRGSDLALARATWRSVSSPAEWAAQGEYYLDRECWGAAAECFKNADDQGRLSLAQAQGLFAERRFAERRFAEALPLLEAAGLLDKAALAYEETGDYRKAGGLWKELGDAPRSKRCLAHALEKEKAFAAAAAAWLKLGDREAALRNLEAGGEHEALARLCRSMKLWEQAARAYAACARHADAAACWRRAGEAGKAAEAYCAAEAWEKAARCYALARRPERVADCWLRAGLYEKAALSFLDLRELPKAIEAYRGWLQAEPEVAPRLSSEGAALMLTEPRKAAVILSACGESAMAGQTFLTAGERGLALAEFRAAGDKAALAACLEAQGDYQSAALEIEREAPESYQAIRLLRLHLHHGQANSRLDLTLARKLVEEAKDFEAKGDFAPAANRYVATVQDKAARRCLLELDRDDLAFDFFGGLGLFDELGSYIRDKRRLRLSHEWLMLEAKRLAESRWSAEQLPRWPYLLDALARFRGEEDLANEDFRGELAALLPLESMGGYALLTDTRHLGALDLLVHIGHMDALLLIWRLGILGGASETYSEEFDSRMVVAQSEGPRAPWFRSFRALVRGDREAAALELEGIEGTEAWNRLFHWVATRRSARVLTWYCERGAAADFEDPGQPIAIDGLIASFIDAQANPGGAAPWYERAGMLQQALRCYRAVTGEGRKVDDIRRLARTGRTGAGGPTGT